MKTPGAVYRKLKEVKFHHLISLYKSFLKRSPENCRYNFAYEIKGSDGLPYIIRLCLCHQDKSCINPSILYKNKKLSGIIPHLLDVCQAEEQCKNCNAYVGYSREDVKRIFEEELLDKSVKEKKYPDICALEWVLERTSTGIMPSKIQAFFILIKKFFSFNKGKL